jgi:hypothetical protein
MSSRFFEILDAALLRLLRRHGYAVHFKVAAAWIWTAIHHFWMDTNYLWECV